MRRQHTERTILRSVGTSAVALVLVAGAAFATSDLISGGHRNLDTTPVSAEQSPEPSESAEPTESPEASQSAEPSESPEASQTAEPTESPEATVSTAGSTAAEPTESPEPSESAKSGDTHGSVTARDDDGTSGDEQGEDSQGGSRSGSSAPTPTDHHREASPEPTTGTSSGGDHSGGDNEDGSGSGGQQDGGGDH